MHPILVLLPLAAWLLGLYGAIPCSLLLFVPLLMEREAATRFTSIGRPSISLHLVLLGHLVPVVFKLAIKEDGLVIEISPAARTKVEDRILHFTKANFL